MENRVLGSRSLFNLQISLLYFYHLSNATSPFNVTPLVENAPNPGSVSISRQLRYAASLRCNFSVYIIIYDEALLVNKSSSRHTTEHLHTYCLAPLDRLSPPLIHSYSICILEMASLDGVINESRGRGTQRLPVGVMLWRLAVFMLAPRTGERVLMFFFVLSPPPGFLGRLCVLPTLQVSMQHTDARMYGCVILGHHHKICCSGLFWQRC